jgi:proton glutamate symport protein
MKNKFLLAGLALYLVAALVTLAASHGVGAAAPAGEILRWLALVALLAYAVVSRKLTPWILVSMVLGAELGYDFPHFSLHLRILSQIFLQMVRVIIAPLIFATLVSGIAGHANLKQVGRMGLKSIIYFEIITTIALFLGLAAINLSKAGVGVALPATATAGGVAQTAHLTGNLTASDFILHIFPENIAKSVAENQVLQVVVFSIIFGIALAMVRGEKRKPVLAFTESLTEVMFQFTNIVMLLAPAGIAGAIAYTVAGTGFGVLYNLGKLVATAYIAIAVFVLVALVPSAWIARLPVGRFARAVAEAATIAFSTASSEAALPRAMESMEAFGVPRKIVAFVIPLGYSFNLTGTTLYLAMGTIFVAQAAGWQLSISQQLTMMLVLMLISKGAAGVPRAVIVLLLAASDQFGLPKDPILILLGVDQFMDMGRTALNVVGNCLASGVVARWEGEFGKERPSEAVREAVEA